MKKIFLLLFLFTFNFSFSFANEAIKAQVRYNESSAKIEAFKKKKKKVDKSFYRKYLKDINKVENIENIKKSNFFVANNRHLCPFYIENTFASYSVTYENDIEYTFYYNIFGNLVKFDKTVSFDYPVKTYSYSRFGNLISVTFSPDDDEQFIYSENGKLLAHWIGDSTVKKPFVFKFLNLKRGENIDTK